MENYHNQAFITIAMFNMVKCIFSIKASSGCYNRIQLHGSIWWSVYIRVLWDLPSGLSPIPRLALISDFFQYQYQDMSWLKVSISILITIPIEKTNFNFHFTRGANLFGENKNQIWQMTFQIVLYCTMFCSYEMWSAQFWGLDWVIPNGYRH